MNLGGVIHLNKTGLCLVCGVCLLFVLYTFSNMGTSETSQHVGQVNLRKLLLVAIEAAQKGGKEVVGAKNNIIIESKGKTKEGANDSVTTADYNSHCVMKGTLMHHFPRVTVISEEEKTICKDMAADLGESELSLSDGLQDMWIDEKEVTVWIDPLDATKEYTEKLYQYVTTMVCVAVKSVPIIGVIHNPFSQKTSWAWEGKGKSEDLKNIPQEGNSDEVRFIVSRSHSGQIKETLKRRFPDAKIIEAAGAGYKVLEVINGNAEAYVHNTAIKKWDICAGNAIINSVGGKMTTKNNKIISYSDVRDVVNEDGLIVTMKSHETFVGIL